MDQPKIRVLVVDDQVIVREGISLLLSQVEGIEVVGEAGDGQQAIAQAEALNPDVILMDLVMPGMDGIEATRQITAACKDARVLVLTSYAGDDKVIPAIEAGAQGFLLKDSSPADLLRAIRHIHEGRSSLDPAIASQVLLEIKQPAQPPPPPDPLTERELEVLRLVATGLSNTEIAGQLVITEATVRSHVSNILGKLHLSNRVQATLYALQEGIISLEEVRGRA
ncbi:MAG: response regulator transcription factor [Anaerolineae bacterium]|jgi:NarL family two-component system response regulator LiaR